LAIDPNYYKALYNLGLLQRKVDRDDEALITFKRAIDARPDSVEALMQLGETQFRKGAFNEAIETLKRAARLEDSAECQYLLGRALQDAGHEDEALQAYRNAVALEPKHVNAQRRLARTLFEGGEHDECRRHLELLVSLDQDDDTAVELAKQARLAKKADLAVMLCDICIRAKATPAAHAERGYSLKDLKKYEEALPDLRLAAAGNQRAQRELARCLRAVLKQNPERADLAAELSALNPPPPANPGQPSP
jgi:tetratricopeptide (TPR) repeat protein